LALVGAAIAGPRKGRFGPNGKVNPMPGHNIPLGVVGSIILFFGWFGFNAGSSFGMTGAFGQLAANAALNTLVAGAAGGTIGMLLSWVLSENRKPDIGFVVNCMLGALAGVTTSCAFVESSSAVLIGSISGLLTYGATKLLERLRIDDPAGAVPVHFVNGIWGLIAVGLFGAGLPITRGWNGMDRAVTGLFYGSTGQLTMQLIAALSIVTFVGLTSTLFFYVLKISDLLRPSQRDEVLGLDVTEMGMAGYNDDGAMTGQAERKQERPAQTNSSGSNGFDPQRAWSIVTGGGSMASLVPPGLPAPRPDPVPAQPPSTRPKSNLTMKQRAAMMSAERVANPPPPVSKPTDKDSKPEKESHKKK
jgi:ammonium transporter, Amt family